MLILEERRRTAEVSAQAALADMTKADAAE
jgi:hypothetical protein